MMETPGPGPGTADAPLGVVRWAASQNACPPCSRRQSARRLGIWRSADTVLASRTASNLVVATCTTCVASVCVADGGLVSFITNLPALAVVWGALYGLIRLGRGWRGVQPPRHVVPRGQAGQATRWRIARELPPSRHGCLGFANRMFTHLPTAQRDAPSRYGLYIAIVLARWPLPQTAHAAGSSDHPSALAASQSRSR